MLADLQWRLYEFGHSLNPEAPIRLKEFTPLCIGTTVMGNFKSFGNGVLGSGVHGDCRRLLWTPGLLMRAARNASRRAACRKVAAAMAAVILLLAGASQPSAQPMALQALVDAAQPGSTLEVPAGDYAGPVKIRGPLTVTAAAGATIDGGGRGSVVVIEGAGVRFRGFTVRNSGRDVTEEAAGITITGNGQSSKATGSKMCTSASTPATASA